MKRFILILAVVAMAAALVSSQAQAGEWLCSEHHRFEAPIENYRHLDANDGLARQDFEFCAFWLWDGWQHHTIVEPGEQYMDCRTPQGEIIPDGYYVFGVENTHADLEWDPSCSPPEYWQSFRNASMVRIPLVLNQ